MSATAPRTHFFSTGLRRALSSRIAATLAYPHGVDRYVEHFAPTFSLNEVRAEVTAVRYQTGDSVTMTLRPNGNWQGFRAGQYVRLTVEINGVRRTRCYSPANSVHAADGLIELTAKAHAGGFVSRHLQQELQVGTTVGLSQAEGTFALPETRPSRVLLISGGSGITPVMAMLRTLCDEGHAGQITFLHYSNAAKDQIYAAELAEIAAKHPNVQLLRGYVEADQGGELSGLFGRAHLNDAVPDYAEAQTFLCGPPGMMKAVQKLWADERIAERLHLEHFTAAPVVIDSANSEGEVRFARSERLAKNSGATLLDQAEAAGLKPESGCRMGICHACTCRKTAGRVRDTRTGEISDAGEGDIQICISVPVGTVTIEI
ncbi:ferredoxin reductase [Nevskia ramosa]|uniref:ferredoxin reductase n=1 Tax=Nevskia ramosa TaxID=64002 RepID=UPI0003B5F034|nr:ferredoxin reductase [Nevskia ramosa]